MENIDKVLNPPVEKLDDEAILNVSGGVADSVRLGASLGVMGLFLSVFALGIPAAVRSFVYANKSKKAHEKGDNEEERRCSEESERLKNISIWSFGAGTSASLGIGAGTAATLHILLEN